MTRCQHRCDSEALLGYPPRRRAGPGRGGTSMYDAGWRRCRVCDLFLLAPDLTHCPCCGHRLATRPRHGRTAREREHPGAY